LSEPQPDSSELAAPAWHGPAFNPRNKFTAGLLRLRDGRLSFTTDNGVAFDVPVTEIADIKFAFGDSLLKLTAAGTNWRFFFAQPRGANAAVAAGGALAVGGGAFAAASSTKSIIDSRHVGKAFKAALS
jgi:hypothetical protein